MVHERFMKYLPCLLHPGDSWVREAKDNGHEGVHITVALATGEEREGGREGGRREGGRESYCGKIHTDALTSQRF